MYIYIYMYIYICIYIYTYIYIYIYVIYIYIYIYIQYVYYNIYLYITHMVLISCYISIIAIIKAPGSSPSMGIAIEAMQNRLALVKSQFLTHDGSMVLLYIVTWIPSIYPIYVSIYTSTMDPSWVIIPW